MDRALQASHLVAVFFRNIVLPVFWSGEADTECCELLERHELASSISLFTNCTASISVGSGCRDIATALDLRPSTSAKIMKAKP